jgi:hypothetical protein
MGCTNVTMAPPRGFHNEKIVSIVTKKCSIKLDYNQKMFDRTRLQLDRPVTMDLFFS